MIPPIALENHVSAQLITSQPASHQHKLRTSGTVDMAYRILRNCVISEVGLDYLDRVANFGALLARIYVASTWLFFPTAASKTSRVYVS